MEAKGKCVPLVQFQESEDEPSQFILAQEAEQYFGQLKADGELQPTAVICVVGDTIEDNSNIIKRCFESIDFSEGHTHFDWDNDTAEFGNSQNLSQKSTPSYRNTISFWTEPIDVEDENGMKLKIYVLSCV